MKDMPMKRVLCTYVLLMVLSKAPAGGFLFDISPAGSDSAVGMAGANEVPSNASTGTGNEIGAGISYDDTTDLLTLNFAYGTSKGFVDLTSDYNGGMHIHKGAVGVAGGVVIPIFSLNAPDTARSGEVHGDVGPLTGTQEADLLAGLYYINIHSVGLPGGEIRGQLILVPEPRGYLCAAALALTAFVIGRRVRAKSV